MKPTDMALTKADTVALWHAVNWMELCVRQPYSEGTPQEVIDAERERLRTAKRALRKVNAIRKAQAEGTPQASRTSAEPQPEQKQAGGPP
jgi:hypothetical protein